ncbi:MAG: sucrase ferredoxin [Nocardioidaceae bacterium]
MSGSFRCAAASLGRCEPALGTASTVRSFLLIEDAGPWGAHALTDSRLPSMVKAWLVSTVQPAGVRPLLIRPHGRSRSPTLRVFAAYAHPESPWMETTVVDQPEDLLDLDVAALATGRSLGLTPHPRPVFLVCTHGRRDVCCAERGRPVAKELFKAYPDHGWEVSHIGGDRFAANMLVLPDGLYYGRVQPSDVTGLADQHVAGHLDLEHLRGRCGYGFAVQAAEWYLRRELNVSELGALRLRSRSSDGNVTDVGFSVDDQLWRVRVRTTSAAPQRLTCGANAESAAPERQLVDITLVQQAADR